MSAGVCGFASSLSADAACFGLAGCAIWASAEASWKVEATGFARGTGTGSADLAGAAAAITLAGAVFPRGAGAAAPSSSSSFDLLLNKEANRPGLLLLETSSPDSALFDVGERQLVALQRFAVGGNMHGAAVGEYPGQLVVVHARPVPDAAGIEMDERRPGGRIEPDAATLQAKPGGADLLERHFRNEEIDGVAEHVLAVAGHP